MEFERVVPRRLYHNGDGASPAVVAGIRKTYATSGWRGLCRARLAGGHEPPASLALLYAQVGDTEHAIEQLQKGYDERDFFLIFVGVDPILAELHSDPRFVEITRRIGVG